MWCDNATLRQIEQNRAFGMLATGTNIKGVSVLLSFSRITVPNLIRKETISTYPGMWCDNAMLTSN